MKEYIGVDLGKRKAVVVKKGPTEKGEGQGYVSSNYSGTGEVFLETGPEEPGGSGSNRKLDVPLLDDREARP